uniref:Uncharacterized protein n=1 Tax=Molossus molossus TaxID=27622 RepID=A0A7J8C8P6_MOLMO|nr:hypothetical protein HJG59_009892 [Molossus molossus]
MNSLVKSKWYCYYARFADGETKAQMHCHFSRSNSHISVEAYIQIEHLVLEPTSPVLVFCFFCFYFFYFIFILTRGHFSIFCTDRVGGRERKREREKHRCEGTHRVAATRTTNQGRGQTATEVRALSRN